MNNRDKFPNNQYPFSDELCLFMDHYPTFFKSLKLSKPKRFEFIPLIFTSHTPSSHLRHQDEIIGMWYLDKNRSQCKQHSEICVFKQDFIINTRHTNKEFISYSTNNKNGKYVRPIVDFFNLYGENGRFYHDGEKWQHHYSSVKDLPNEPRLRWLAKKLLEIKL